MRDFAQNSVTVAADVMNVAAPSVSSSSYHHHHHDVAVVVVVF